jgi:molecular chaperone GrpE (heat shock protein)
MLTALKRWLGAAPPGAEHVLALEREAQDLRLQLQECRAKLAALEQERQRERAGEARREGERVGQLLERVAAPVAQLSTQAHLLEEGKPVQARDVLAVARRIVRALEDEGLAVEGTVGAEVSFDPDRHAPLGGGEVKRGEKVVVRFPAVCREGRVVHRAGVEKGHG